MGDTGGMVARRERLIDCAEAAIAGGGLAAIKARALAACVGCSVGAIYNDVADLDELVLRVNARTLAALDADLDKAVVQGGDVEAQLVSYARAYASFAARHRNAWRTLFEFRMGEGSRELPHWFATDQLRLLERLHRALATLMPGHDPSVLRRRARTLFSAVHGIVALALEEKLADRSASDLDGEIVAFVGIFVTGLAETRFERR